MPGDAVMPTIPRAFLLGANKERREAQSILPASGFPRVLAESISAKFSNSATDSSPIGTSRYVFFEL